jgi:hypothetical protein
VVEAFYFLALLSVGKASTADSNAMNSTHGFARPAEAYSRVRPLKAPELRKELVQALQGYRLWSSDLDAHRPTGGTAVDDEKPVCSMRIAAWLVNERSQFERSIDIETYDRHAEKLREELTLVRIVTLASSKNSTWRASWRAERVLPRAADLWVQASLDQRSRFQ